MRAEKSLAPPAAMYDRLYSSRSAGRVVCRFGDRPAGRCCPKVLRPRTARSTASAPPSASSRAARPWAAASAPRFDLGLFTQPDAARWREVVGDPLKPLFHRATEMALPPGSTFKTISAAAILESGRIDPERMFFCQGYLDAPERYRCFTFRNFGVGHGELNFASAMARSCNVYFYHAGLNAGIDAIVEVAKQFGLGVKTGLRDLPGEVACSLASPATKAALKNGERWFPGDTANAAIGQGFNQFTPLQMAVYTATLANGGTRYRPYLVQEIRDGRTGRVLWEAQPDPLGTVDLPTAYLERVREAMVTVTRANGGWSGTAYGVFRDAPYVVAGKTGTAEVGANEPEYENHGWFIAFAPAGEGEEPEIAVAVVIHAGGGGALAAGPVARAILDAYFAGRYGLPDDPRETAEQGHEDAAQRATSVPAD